MQPEATVLIAAFNQGKFLQSAIESVLGQSFPADKIQIIVVDDGSTDETSSLRFQYETSLCWIFKKNGGQASAWNAAWPQVKGRLVFFLDADDRWKMNKLERCIEHFQKNDRLDCIYHYLYLIDSSGKKTGSFPNERIKKSKKEIYNEQNFLDGKISYWAPSSGIGLRKTCLEKMVPIPEDYKICADGYLQMQIPFKAREFQLMPEYLADLRVHGKNGWTARLETPQILAEQIAMQKKLMAVVQAESDFYHKDSSGIFRKMQNEIEEKEIDRLNILGQKALAWQKAWSYRETGSFAYRMFKKAARLFSILIGRNAYLKIREVYQKSPFISWVHSNSRL